MDKKQEAIEKVKKLMAMASPEGGATESEQDTAMRMAAGIMLRFGISEDDVKDKEEEGVTAWKTSDQLYTQKWIGTLGAAAAVMNMTKCLIVPTDGTVIFTGRPTNIETTRVLFDYLIDQVLKAYKAFPLKSIPPKDRRTFRESFKFNAANALFIRCWAIIEELRNDDQKAIAASGSNALVVSSTIDQRLREIDDWIGQNIEVDETKERKAVAITSRGSILGALAGREAGERIEINKKVT